MAYGPLRYTMLLAVVSLPAQAHEGQSELIEELIVFARAQQMLGVAEAASEGIIGYDDTKIPPLLRVGELVEAVPGMVATQHSGTGKANQYFLRGFNLDHGTDFSAFANGVPLNMRTHGHGQGYLDLNFLIPELVATTSYRKGPYSAAVGDFSSAGSVGFDFYDRLEEGILEVTAGEFDYYRALVAGSADLGNGVITAALDATTYRGPWELDEDLEQTKFYVSHAGHLGEGETRIALSAYRGDWNSTDQIPQRAVDADAISRLGNVDPDLGGRTDRYELSASVDYGDWRAAAYVIDYDFALYSNFTYLLANPSEGDQFEQTDKRSVYGARIDGGSKVLDAGWPLIVNWGADLRYDDIDDVSLRDTTARLRTATVRQDSVTELSLGAYADVSIALGEKLRAAAGLRADYFDWNVDALRPENSGTGNDSLLSPKLNLAYRVSDIVEIYANWGRGFHSNDVRGATTTVDPRSGASVAQVDALVRSDGAELGARFELGESFNATLIAFWLELDSELVFVGDAGTTEPNDGSERTGIEFASFWQPLEWLAANFSYTYTDARFRKDTNGGRKVPGAVASTASLGLTAAWESGLFGSVRARYLGESPLVEDNSVRAGDSLLVNAGVGYRWENVELRIEAFNLLDTNDNDITYFYASRLPGEPVDGIEDVHFHPLEPRTFRASVSYHW
ncbi:MAG: TonB-dependent receptor [Aeoliella sp.]